MKLNPRCYACVYCQQCDKEQEEKCRNLKYALFTTEEDKKLLLKDLTARLTYNVKAYVKNWSKLDRKYYEGVYTVDSIHPSLNTVLACSDRFCVEVILGYDDYVINPYLFPMSEMTEEQYNQYVKYSAYESIDWLNKNHFDYRGLIEKGLAIDATNLDIYDEEDF